MRKVKGLMCMVAAAAIGSSVAHAQSCNPLSTGPDIIVGDIQGVQNYPAGGSLDAFAIATYSCNIGGVWVNWFQTTTQHPVVGMNLFKYRVQPAGYATFEQLGQSWLKHTFFALSNNLCCTGCVATDGTHLGIRCADPYTASRNGTQSGAGPKWQVNAHTGAFTYPPANPAFAGNTARRIQATTSDLETSNGGTTGTIRYFVDAQYVAADDAANRNQNNNTSYREVSIANAGSDTNMGTTTSGTVRMKVALEAWKVIDPGVTLTAIDIPSAAPANTSERVYLASKATSLGGGQWHYEFALYNQNSDQSVGSFSVPLPASAVVTNIAFHDVAYRDGDGIGNVNIDGTDWPGVVSGSDISWTTVAFPLNNNGNAVRWGSQYNFRFDCNIPPGVGNVNMATWKTGNPYPAAPTAFTGQAQLPVAPVCYANCDGSTDLPCLNVQDFACFLNGYAAGATSANCDNSTVAPVLNVLDFACYLNYYAVGCSNC